MLNVQRLNVLREVIAQGSFSEAASALNYTQSAVSQAIATLESEAGVPLLERDRRVVRICRAAGFEPRVSFESDDYLTVQGLVAAGVGVALIPQLALSQTVSYDIAVRELHPAGPVRHVVAATPGGGVSLPAAASMLDQLLDTAR